jgi:hypothetical protein
VQPSRLAERQHKLAYPAGTDDTLDYFNHFSLLAGIEKMFGLSTIGYAATPGLPVWTSSVFSGGQL